MARASFSTLPPELKATIVEMTSDQEDAWRERVEDVKATEHAGHINCLSSLALVNKELRELAARHQFKALTASRASLPVFRYSILRKFGHYITEINFESRKDDMEEALLCMVHLPALRTLRLSFPAATLLFGRDLILDHPENDIQTFRVDMLDSIAGRIDTLILSYFDPSEAVVLVRRFPNVKMLGLDSLRPGQGRERDHEERVQCLCSAIAPLRRLKHLTIDLGGGFLDEVWSPAALEPLRLDPPPIKTLQLVNFPWNEQIPRIPGIFASTLQTLCLQIEVGDHPEEEDLDALIPVQLPHLTNLILRTEIPSDLAHISRLLLSASSLTHFAWGGGDLDSNSDSQGPFLPFLATQPTLRRIQFENPIQIYPLSTSAHIDDPPSLAFLGFYADLVHSRNLDRSVLDSPFLSPFYPDAELDYTEAEADVLTSALARTLTFGLVELERMAAEGRVEDAVEWIEELKPLEDKRLAWRD